MKTPELAQKLKLKVLKYFLRSEDGAIDAPQEVRESLDALESMLNDYYHHYNEIYLDKDTEHDCRTFHDGCNCTVSALNTAMELHHEAMSKLQETKDKLSRMARTASHHLAEMERQRTRAEASEHRTSRAENILGWCRDDLVAISAASEDSGWVEQRANSRACDIERYFSLDDAGDDGAG